MKRLLALMVIALVFACGKPVEPDDQTPNEPQDVATVTIIPVADPLDLSQAVQLVAEVKDADGALVTGKTVTWSSSGVFIASVAATGVATGISPGEATITATVDGKSGTTTVRVQGDQPLPPEATSCLDCLEIVPAAVMLPGAGAEQRLEVYRVDGTGNRTLVTATVESSRPGVIAVSSNGTVRAVGAAGSAQLIARVGSESSAPALALAATPAPGVTLLQDADIDETIVAVDSSAPYGVGVQYRVSLSRVVPKVGDVLVNTGARPVGGRVVSVTPAGGRQDVILELLPLDAMLPDLVINESIPLRDAPELSKARRSGRQAADIPVILGPFSCETDAGTKDIFQVTNISTAMQQNLVFDLSNTTGLRVVTHGTITPNASLRLRVTAAVSGKIGCRMTIHQIQVPVAGLVSSFFGAVVPYGVGFDMNVTGQSDALQLDVTLNGSADVAFGIDCTADCTFVREVDNNVTASFVPIVPPVENLQFKFVATPYAWSGLQVGTALGNNNAMGVVDVYAGLRHTITAASGLTQVTDPLLAAGYDLSGVIGAATSRDLALAAALLGVVLPPLKVEEVIPIAGSPTGSFTVTPSDPAAGDATHLGETATFSVHLDRSTYDNEYVVDAVEFRWLQTDSNGVESLEPGRPGCTKVLAAPGQVDFSCTTDFLAGQGGKQKFYAFVHAKLHGVSLPFMLELTKDALVTVDVAVFGHVHREVEFFVSGTTTEADFQTTAPLIPFGTAFAGSGQARFELNSFGRTINGCVLTDKTQAAATFVSAEPTGTDTWALRADMNGSTSTTLCGVFQQSNPYNERVTLANGRSIIRDGVLVGINFAQDVTGGGAHLVGSGRLRIDLHPPPPAIAQ